MNRALAVVERDLRKFFRSPMLLVASLLLPLVQLVVLGNAFGGNIKNVRVAVVNEDGGPAAVTVLEKINAIAANARTVLPERYTSEAQAMNDLREGYISGVVIIPPQYSRDLLMHLAPQIALVTDNTDRFISGSIAGVLSEMVSAINQPAVAPRTPEQAQLEVVELYPYVSYMKYLLPGSITLAIFVTAMIGGGIMYIDDKARGLHEGYLVTPITKFELILGFNLAGVIKAVIAGVVVLGFGSMIAGIHDWYAPVRLAELVLLTFVASAALIGMMFFLMARISDPLVPRAIFGVLNTLLFFPSGAVYPQEAFPPWMRGLARVDPFTYAVHGFRTLLLKQAGVPGVATDLLVLTGIGVLMLAGATLLFRRTL